MSEDSERKVCVILPIVDDSTLRINSKSSLNNVGSFDKHINFETTIESTCFSKPLIVFTIKALKRISCVATIILCSSSNRQEQIQAITSEHLADYEGLKYLCLQNTIPKNGSKSNLHHHDITLNRLLKYCCSFLNETNDIVIVHDPNMPCVNEKIIKNLCMEAFRHGAACLSTTENIKNLFVKIEDCDIEDEEIRPSVNFKTSQNPYYSTSGALVSDYLDSNYRICLKPHAFKYSIFLIIFDNCSDEELDDDIDCLKLAKTHANIRVKLVFEKNQLLNYPKSNSCIQRYLKEIHKQAIFLSRSIDQDVLYLQKILRLKHWGVEILPNLDKEAFLKMNEILDVHLLTNGIVFVKFCENLSDLKEFEFRLSSSSEDTKSKLSQEKYKQSPSNNCLVFMIKKSIINSSANISETNQVRTTLKQNISISKQWHVIFIYDSFNLKTVEFLSYILTDRHQSANGLIFECTEED